jgi:hypothetical protein
VDQKTPEEAAQEIIERRKALGRLEIPRDPEEIQKLVEQRRAAAARAAQPVQVSLSPKGRIRKNGPCPCGSGIKFKFCCLDRVKSGELPPIPKQRRS